MSPNASVVQYQSSVISIKYLTFSNWRLAAEADDSRSGYWGPGLVTGDLSYNNNRLERKEMIEYTLVLCGVTAVPGLRPPHSCRLKVKKIWH